jgi:hypothetical protein
MKTIRITVSALALCASVLAAGAHSHEHVPPGLPGGAPRASDAVTLPPAPAGVTDLRFDEFFKFPVGRSGLEYTDKMRQLDGKKVRIAGYMALQDEPKPGLFLLCPTPFTLHEHEYGLAEDLPATTLHVVETTRPGEIVPHTPGVLVLTGTLHVGSREEADGRVSIARLVLDPPSPQPTHEGGESR